MGYQPIFAAELEHKYKKRKTRREMFLEQMDVLVPQDELEKQVARRYRKHCVGHKPYSISVMLRIYRMQRSRDLNDPAMENHLYEIESTRRFAGLRDEITILNIRHLIEKCNSGPAFWRLSIQCLVARD